MEGGGGDNFSWIFLGSKDDSRRAAILLCVVNHDQETGAELTICKSKYAFLGNFLKKRKKPLPNAFHLGTCDIYAIVPLNIKALHWIVPKTVV